MVQGCLHVFPKKGEKKRKNENARRGLKQISFQREELLESQFSIWNYIWSANDLPKNAKALQILVNIVS